LIKVFSK